MLLTTVVAVAAWIILAGAVFFTQSSEFQLLMNRQTEDQARMYAEADAKLLRFVDYGSLTNPSALAAVKLHTGRGNIQIANAPEWQDEIVIGGEQTSSSGGRYRPVTINVYRKGETQPAYSITVPIVKDAQLYSRKEIDDKINGTKKKLDDSSDKLKKKTEESAQKIIDASTGGPFQYAKNTVTIIAVPTINPNGVIKYDGYRTNNLDEYDIFYYTMFMVWNHHDNPTCIDFHPYHYSDPQKLDNFYSFRFRFWGGADARVNAPWNVEDDDACQYQIRKEYGDGENGFLHLSTTKEEKNLLIDSKLFIEAIKKDETFLYNNLAFQASHFANSNMNADAFSCINYDIYAGKFNIYIATDYFLLDRASSSGNLNIQGVLLPFDEIIDVNNVVDSLNPPLTAFPGNALIQYTGSGTGTYRFSFIEPSKGMRLRKDGKTGVPPSKGSPTIAPPGYFN